MFFYFRDRTIKSVSIVIKYLIVKKCPFKYTDMSVGEVLKWKNGPPVKG